MRSNSLTYMPALDGLRGLAVTMVFIEHALPGNVFPGGLGVDIFFVISGFLITRILLRQHHKTGRIRLGSFYLKRMLRLYPALLAMVAVFAVLWFTLGVSIRDAVTSWIASLLYVSNIVMAHTAIPMHSLRHTWSLAMEEQFYLVWPILLILFLWAKLPARRSWRSCSQLRPPHSSHSYPGRR
ncbi:acyltransferase family protein [Leifsonia poae]|uniref:acyltransferase family protein n=1 Tax=Leifsonia poae TaxID=110933 RepID=UPI003D68D6DE